MRRILLKLSGESLKGDEGYGLSPQRLSEVADEIAAIKDTQIAIVVGGGNIFRGETGEKLGFDRVQGDTIGMLATIINSLAMATALKSRNLSVKVMSAFPMEQIAITYSPNRAVSFLEEGNIVIIGGGSGNAFFTTDTAASLRALQIKADAIIKGTRVKGVFSGDPEMDSNAVFYDELDYDEVLNKRLKVMDQTSFTLCRDNNLPIVVFDFLKADNLRKLINGEDIGTIIHSRR